ncbi:c-type cytochrome biogenesis protein CcsB [Rhodococcus sp. D2-41]|uniref:C-type cytochrome biogenesis protein CcsB n=1 Tax=Speluncibacter jeojiensis TaxID=2710754 RepID=A0A9X4M893_9ACTN|nr:c-type cytochrome biogenesis protein CcsB [Rhodococcus sp. D2-41]MDG3009259.1 c-type cytochrome biogenesis protein CcsB [Rhodococcus sp. D2-41]MDG3016066.1 c-type cytochrome biogenesis protein CcsB [Corynebacteriales bacterium D3-21]
MPVNENLSHYSDLAFGSATGVYVLALLLLLASYAVVRGRAVEAREEARERELVGPAGLTATENTPGRVITDKPNRPMHERLANMGYALVVLGFGLHVAMIVLRGLAVHRIPWGNMYEFVALTCCVGVGAALFMLRRREQHPLMAFVMVPVVILMFVAGTVLYANAAPVVPALQSYWLPIHVTIISIGSGVFLVSGVASALFLFRVRFPKGEEPDTAVGRFAAKLPDARALDRLAYRTVVFAFPVFGAGVICGAIWAEAAWGRFWGWDPKETCSFIAWVIYAAYLHARATAGWRDQKAAWINLAGFVAMLFNLFIINMVVSGLHSYAGLN